MARVKEEAAVKGVGVAVKEEVAVKEAARARVVRVKEAGKGRVARGRVEARGRAARVKAVVRARVAARARAAASKKTTSPARLRRSSRKLLASLAQQPTRLNTDSGARSFSAFWTPTPMSAPRRSSKRNLRACRRGSRSASSLPPC